MPVSDEILKQCKRGDIKAQEYIFKEYSSLLFGICLRYMKERTKADDVMQDAFITIFTKINQFKNTGSFEGWIRRIAVNTSLMQLRKDKKEIVSEFSENIEEEIKEDIADLDINSRKSVIENAKFTQIEIFETLKELPEGFQAVFNMYVIDGLKHKEISRILGISVGTSKSQLLRARKKFEEILYKKALIKLKKEQNK